MNVPDLVTLWHATDDTAGYQHPELVCAVCELAQPRTRDELAATFYPAGPADEDAVAVLEAGWELWQRRLALPRRGSAIGRIQRWVG